MFQKTVRCAAAAVILAQLLSAVPSAFAATEAERAAYEQKAKEKRQESEAIQSQIDSVSEEKRILDEEADVAIENHEKLSAVLAETEGRIAENEEKLTAITADYDRKNKQLGKRVRDIYVNGQISYLDVLFGAKDFGDLMTRMDLLKRVMQDDYNLVQIVIEEKRVMESARKVLEADKASQEKQVESARKARLEMELKVRKRQELINKMMNDKAIVDKQYDEFMAASKQIEEMIRRSSYRVNPQVYGGSGSGAMLYPLSGPITSPFGWRTHPITGSRSFHSGIDIGGDYGQPIYAALGGTVSYAGWISGYGNTVMIEHGGGIVTLYGHNQGFAVSVGQSVSQGQLISYCGSTGNSTGPHCHFEVRQNGSPVNPMNYL